ncbi:MAG: coproporphyrinogen dehydrogenase HemZ [Clostridiales bacterium]|nr:coproporphyrinogen dehydrogenase HemZ [Clostridiales bacterium]
MEKSRITVRLQGHEYYYPVSDILRLFTGSIPKEEECAVVCDAGALAPLIVDDISPEKALVLVSSVSDDFVETFAAGEDGNGCDDAAAKGERILMKRSELTLPLNREVKRQLYFLLSKITGKAFPWGSLTGIRPTQVARELASEEEMTSVYGVREDKAHLAFLTQKKEDDVLSTSSPDALHIYIGIPFCPSRCSYCSFISQEAPKKTELLPSYVDAVLHEMDQVLPKIGDKIETLYIGGGTPTVLPEVLFEKFIRGVFSHPELSSLKEVCVEAGRPDTITEKKLQVLQQCGVRRICINPQTLCDSTLARVGRRHSAEDFVRAYELAKKMGFSIINTDLIAGLPGESSEEFCDSLRRIIGLSPENITVHSLSKKRRSSLRREEIVRSEEEELKRIESMLSFASSSLLGAGYFPYYMYKQKDTLGGHENVGYSREGTECLYNVAMMSDLRSVLSFGAGGMSKRVFINESSCEGSGNGASNVRVERCSCIKDPIQYMQNVDAMAEKKIRFFTEK